VTDIVWEEPPKPKSNSRSGLHEAIAAQLRAKPGQWARVIAAGHSTAAYIKSGRLPAYQPAGAFEAVARNSRLEDGRKTQIWDIYARYIGDGST
jgi:hypothetical protein